MNHSIQDCPFCKPKCASDAFMESRHALGIYNLAPILRGHSLIIPKRHVTSILDMSQEELSDFMEFAVKVTRVLRSAFVGTGFDWSLQEGADSGQSVSHMHLHIVIRRPGDLPENENWYEKVRDHESNLLDSEHRPKLSEEEYRFYIDFIRAEYQKMSGTLLQEE